VERAVHSLSPSLSLARSICPEFFLPSALNTSLRPSCEYYYSLDARHYKSFKYLLGCCWAVGAAFFVQSYRRVVQRYLRVSLWPYDQ
jgi:hypothetical protein